MKLHLLLSAVLQLAVSEFVGFVANDGEIYVDGKTTDSDGTSDKPYKFIAGALDGKSEAVTIVMVDGTHAAEESAVTLAYAHTISGDAANKVTKSVKAIENGVFKATLATGTVKFEKMTFQLVSYKIQTGKTAAEGDQATPLSSNVFVLSDAGTLALDTVDFKMYDLTTAQQAYAEVDAITAEIIKAEAGSVALTSVTFTGTNMGTGKSLIDTSTAGVTLALTSSTFTTITLADKPLLAVSTETGKFSITTAATFRSITRTSAETNRGGSVLEVALIDGNTFALKNAVFKACTITTAANQAYGKAVYISVADGCTGVVDAGTLTFSDSAASRANEYTGITPHVFVSCKKAYAEAHGRELKGLIDSTDNTATNYIWLEDASDDTKYGNIGALPEIYYVGVTAADNEKCTEAAPCTSLAAAYNKADGSSYTAAKKMVKVKVEAVALSDAVVVAKDITVEGADADNSKLTIAAEPASGASLIKVDASSAAVSVTISTLTITISVATAAAGSTGNIFKLEGSNTPALTLTSVTVKTGVAADAACHLANSLIDASAGTLTLSGCTFSGITLANAPLISQNKATGKLVFSTTASTFTSITRTTGSPAVLDVELDTDKGVALENVQFTACSPAAIALDIKAYAAGVFSIDATSCTFAASSESADAEKWTKDLHAMSITAADTTHLFGSSSAYNLDAQLSDLDDHDYKYWATVGAAASVVSTDLYKFQAAPTTGAIYVKVTGADSDYCGWEDLPCQTVARGLTNRAANDIPVKVLYDEDAQASNTLFTANGWEPAKTVTLEGVADTTSGDYPTISVGTTQTGTAVQVSGVQTGTVEVTIKKLIFSYTLTSEDYTHSLFTVQNYDAGQVTSRANTDGDATLVLDTVTITSDPGSGKVKTESIIAVTSGELKLKTVNIISIELDAVPVFKLDTGATFTMTPAGSNPEVDPCLFADITSGANAAIFDLTNPTITIQNAIFMACKGTKAGVAYVTGLAGDTVTWTKPLLFTGCDATTKTAEYAANVYVELTGATMTQAADGDFNEDTGFSALKDLSSTQGGDFKFSKVGATSGNGDNLEMFTWAAEDNTYYVSGTGLDTAAGTRAAPLRTIAKALTTASTTASTIKLLGGMHDAEAAAVTLSIAHTITGLGETADDVMQAVTAVTNGVFVVSNAEGTVTISKITFILDAGLTSNVFVKSAAGTLALTTVSFEVDGTSALTAEVISATAGTVAMTSVAFTELAMGTGKSLIDASAATLTLSACTFTSITLADKPLLAIAADKFSIAEKDESGTAVDATVFDQITRTAGTNTTAGGSVLEVAVPDTKTLSLKNAEFYKCEVGATYKPYGMALYISFWGTGVVDASGLKFSATAKPSNAITAPFVYVVCETDAYANAHGRELKGLIGTGDETEADIYVWKGTSDAADINGLDEIYYVAQTGSDDSTCLTATAACDALSTAYTELKKSTFAGKKIIKVTESEVALTAVEFTSNVDVIGADATNSKLAVTAASEGSNTNGVIEVSGSAVVSLSSLTFSIASETVTDAADQPASPAKGALAKSVIYSTSTADLTLTTVTFTMVAAQEKCTLAPLTASVIAITAGSVSMSTVAFTGILGAGEGAALNAQLSSTLGVSLSTVTFTDCSSAKGVMYLAADNTVGTSSLTMTSVSFKTTAGGSAAEMTWTEGSVETCAIVLSGALANVIDTTNNALKFISSTTLTQTDEYMYYLADTTLTTIAALWHYVAASTATTYKVSQQSGTSHTTCGWDDLPCQTVGAAYSHKGEATTTISVATGTNALTASNAILELTTTISIEGSLDNGELSTTFGVQGLADESDRDACIKITPQASAITATFKDLIVGVTSAENAGLTVPVFKIDTVDNGNAAPTLALENVKVTGETTLVTALTASVVDATEGTLTLTGCTFTGITLDDSPLLTVSTATGKFSITATTTFSKIIRTSGNGAVFEATVDKDGALAIAKATFTKCGTLNGNGGALAVTVKGGSFKLGTASFKGCFAATETTQTNDDTTTGQGGAMYVSVAENAKNANVDMSAVSVFGATASNNGGGVYVEVQGDTNGVSLNMKDVTVSESKSSQSGGGVFVQVAKDSKDVALSMESVSVSKSESTSGKGNGVYMEVKSESAKLNLTSVKVSQESDVAKDSSSIFVAVPESIANDANVWADLVDSNPDSADSFAVATVDENGNISTETKSIKTIVDESRKEDPDGFPAWAIVLIVIGSILIIAAVVIIIICCCCRKGESSSDSKSREMDRV